MNIYEKLKSPLCIQLELTSGCNCRCTHCYNYWRPENGPVQHLTKEVADKVLEVLKENQIPKICLTGGEPFLNFEMFKYITEKCQETHISVSSNTNMSVINDEQIKWVIENKIKLFTTIMGYDAKSHDSMTNNIGSYTKSITNIKKCIDNGLDVMVNIVITQNNLKDAYKIAESLCKIGVRTLFASIVYCPEYAKNTDYEKYFYFSEKDIGDLLNSMLSIKERYSVNVSTITTFPLCSLIYVNDISPFINRRCVAGRTEIGISSTGKVKSCAQSDNFVGDIMTEDFSDIWERLSYHNTEESYPKECISCPLFKLCSGGCRVSSKSKTGMWNDKDPLMKEENVSIILQKIKKNIRKLQKSKDEIFGQYRDESFGQVFIRNDGNYMLLDKNKSVKPIILKRNKCYISDNCEECPLYDTCYSIHNCR